MREYGWGGYGSDKKFSFLFFLLVFSFYKYNFCDFFFYLDIFFSFIHSRYICFSSMSLSSRMKNNFFPLFFIKRFHSESIKLEGLVMKICTFKYCMNLIIYNAVKEVERLEEFKEWMKNIQHLTEWYIKRSCSQRKSYFTEALRKIILPFFQLFSHQNEFGEHTREFWERNESKKKKKKKKRCA